MKYLFTFLLILFALPLWGEHHYYHWAGSMELSEADSAQQGTSFDLLIDFDSTTQLVMGEVCYHREVDVPLRLYGQAFTIKEEEQKIKLYEVLPSGSCSAIITLLLKGGQCTEALWEESLTSSIYSKEKKRPQHKHKLLLTEALPYPSTGRPALLQPLGQRKLEGVYAISHTGGFLEKDFDQVEISSLSDSIFIANFSITSYPNMESFFLVMHRVGPNLLQSHMNGKKASIVQAYIFDDCVCFTYEQRGERFLSNIKMTYLRQPDKEAYTYPYIYDKDFSLDEFITVRRKADNISVRYNFLPLMVEDKQQYIELNNFISNIMLTNVRSGVKQIFCADVPEYRHPVLAILNQDSTLQIISLLDALLNNYTDVSEPLPHLKGITGFAYQDTTLTSRPDHQSYYAIDAQGQYHEVPINTLANKITFSKQNSPNRHTIDITYDWAIHYTLEAAADSTFGSYTCQYDGQCWLDTYDHELLYYTFTRVLDTRDPSTRAFTKPCRIKGSLRIVKGDDGQYTIRPITGISFK